MTVDQSTLIYDWNDEGPSGPPPARGRVELNDETLRDGLQSPSVRSPSQERKVEILYKMVELGIDAVDIGLPGAGPHVVESVLHLAREIADQRLPIQANCAARTLRQDIEPVVDISQQVGLPIEVACFLGSSPIRQYAEGWDIDRLLRFTERAVSFAVDNGLPVMFVTEDTTRAAPEDLKRLYTAAVEAGAQRVCIADTVGAATPRGTRRLVRFLREVVDEAADDVQIDWHGHRDRGFGVANALVAAAAGADRLHATANGIGERVGNTQMDLLMINLRLLGWIDQDLTALPEYCALVAQATGIPIPDNYPVIGRDAFRTGTGVHAAAIIKAKGKGDDWLADRIYSGIPASWVGRRQEIEIGPMSGQSNVVCWLEERGIEPTLELVEVLFGRAKEANAVLEEQEILQLCRESGVKIPD